MKCIVETTGKFSLISGNGDHIKDDRPSVVSNNSFIESRMYRGDLRILAKNLPPEASDVEFYEFYIECKKNTELAVNSYCAKFGLNTQGEATETVSETKAERKEREKAEKEKAQAEAEAEAALKAQEEADEAIRLAKEKAEQNKSNK